MLGDSPTRDGWQFVGFPPDLLTSCGLLQTSLTGDQEARSTDGGDSTARWMAIRGFPAPYLLASCD